ncbi:MAG: glycosyltransferase family 2 protein [Bacteroidales bacterium]
MSTPELSIVSPVYRGEKLTDELVRRIISAVEPLALNFEIVLVEDGSTEASWNKIAENCVRDKRVKGIRLSRNFGQHQAITAGLAHVKGTWVVVMDCDLQDQPEEIPALYARALQGFDIVQGKREERQDGFFKRSFSKTFYRVLGYLTDTRQDSSIANFGIYHQKVIRAILSMGDPIRYFPAMVRWVGFRQTSIPVAHAPRIAGSTSYSFRKLLRLGLDVILSFSEKPLRLTVKLGLTISFLSLLMAVYFLVRYLEGKILISGWASLIVSIWFLAGIIIFLIGTVGLYIGKTFESSKNRPVFIIDESINLP